MPIDQRPMTPAERLGEIRKMRAAVQADLDCGNFDRQEAKNAVVYLDDTGYLLDQLDRSVSREAVEARQGGGPVTDTAERVRTLRKRLKDAAVAHGTWAAAPLTNADGLWLADQLDRSASREAAALATPPGAKERVLAAVDRFERDLGFTAPELTGMRVSLLREAVEDAFADEEDEEDGSDRSDYEDRSEDDPFVDRMAGLDEEAPDAG